MSSPRDAATEPGGADWDEVPVALGATMGRYQLRAVVGAGGMGVVFEALDPELARSVAVKVLRSRAGPDSEGEARLKREGQSMAQLTHPNVIRVYDVGVAHGHAFVAMEFVAGTTLGGWLEAAARTPAEILERYIAAGNGLAAAHAIGLVHRDFKPGNVLVGDDGRVLVTDFGLARAVRADAMAAVAAGADAAARRAPVLAASVTVTGFFVGTPAYMAPEQYSNTPVDARADQFSFCVALWRALFATAPYAGTTVDELVAAAEAGALVPPPPAAAAKVSPAVRVALERGLRARPGERFGSMRELLAELEARPSRRWVWPVVAAGVFVAAGATVYGLAARDGDGDGGSGSAPVATAPPAEETALGGVAAPPPGEAAASDATLDAAVIVDAPVVVVDAPPTFARRPDAAPRAPKPDASSSLLPPPPLAAECGPWPELPANVGCDLRIVPMILDPMFRRARSCGGWTTADGYQSEILVADSGAVTSVEVTGPDPAIAGCMKRMFAHARFPRTVHGGNISSNITRK